ncbi:MAG TPA: PHP domain-containing protein [Clostridia bacterium]|jgi:PHP family Zn ribbon phosphoesterase|nr:PHP domain-containing protein [Clostridia bacterium]
MDIALDLHIHSVLSPCGDSDMTPNNIVNMACLKGLDAIAVTDHNSAENVEAVMELGHKKGIVVLPGMEVQSREEVHFLCYFQDLEGVLGFQQRVYDHLVGENRPDFFGEQVVMDNKDRVKGYNDRLLIGSVELSVEQIVNMVTSLGGRVVPAHVDKKTYSIISNLGFIPPGLDIKSVEVSDPDNTAGLLRQYSQLKGYRIIHSSDAHRLGDILEREFFMEVREKSVPGILEQL